MLHVVQKLSDCSTKFSFTSSDVNSHGLFDDCGSGVNPQQFTTSVSTPLRGLPLMTSAQRGGGRSNKKYPKFADKQYIKFGQKEEGGT